MTKKVRVFLLPAGVIVFLVLAAVILSVFLPRLGGITEKKSLAETLDYKKEAIYCGCGCCPNTTPERKCLGKGETLKKIADQNARAATDMDCYTKGCERGTIYELCE